MRRLLPGFISAAALALGLGLALVPAPAGTAPADSAAPAVRRSGARSEASESAASGRRRVPRPVTPDTAVVTLGREDSQAFVAYPPGKGVAPGVVVVHEWWGLNAQIRETARRLARQGYVAIVPDLYAGKLADDPESAHVLARGLDDAEALRQIDAAERWLAASPRVGKRRRAVIGFCMGGHLALLAGMESDRYSGVVMFYGSPESRPERLAALDAPLLGHFGAEDAGIPVPRVEAFELALRGAGKTAEVFVYADAGHAFMNEQQAGYRPESARLAWVRTLDFLQKHVKDRP